MLTTIHAAMRRLPSGALASAHVRPAALRLQGGAVVTSTRCLTESRPRRRLKPARNTSSSFSGGVGLRGSPFNVDDNGEDDDNGHSDDDEGDDESPHNWSGGAPTDGDNQRKAEPWKTLLEMSARAAWRVSSTQPPPALERTQQELLLASGGHEHRRLSPKRLRQAHEKKVVPAQRALADRRDRERRRTVLGKGYNPSDAKRDAAAEPILYGPEEALAAIKYRLFPNFAITRRVLLESQSLVGSDVWKPKRVIDFGIGIGGASAAALEVWRDDVEWIHGIDASQTMRDGALAVLEGFAAGDDARLDVDASPSTSSSPSRTPPRITLSAHLSAEASLPTFDLALFAYTANELQHVSTILAAAAILWEKLLPNGLFVMIEPGTPDGFLNVRTVRNMLLDCYPPNHSASGPGDDEEEAAAAAIEEEECHILAPCTHNGSCPMEQYRRQLSPSSSSTPTDDSAAEENAVEEDLDEDSASDEEKEDGDGREKVHGEDEPLRKSYCSFVQTMPGVGHFRSKGEKFSYIVAQKRIRGQYVEAEHRFHSDRLSDLLHESRLQGSHDTGAPGGNDTSAHRAALDLEARFLDSDDDDLGLEFLRGDVNRSSFGRIVLAPKKRKGHVIIDCCEAPGQLVRHSVSKSMSRASPGLYTAARKSRWGGYWPRAQNSTTSKEE